uniref:Uncharacterized protein n=1 Tax=Esox lucius TaxID=8010 RepID=A0A3P8YQ00_ESOLU
MAYCRMLHYIVFYFPNYRGRGAFKGRGRGFRNGRGGMRGGRGMMMKGFGPTGRGRGPRGRCGETNGFGPMSYFLFTLENPVPCTSPHRHGLPPPPPLGHPGFRGRPPHPRVRGLPPGPPRHFHPRGPRGYHNGPASPHHPPPSRGQRWSGPSGGRRF